MGSRVGWEVAKTTSWGILGAAMTLVGTHTMAHALLVGHTAVRAILDPHHLIGILHWCNCYSHDWKIDVMPSDQLTFNIICRYTGDG